MNEERDLGKWLGRGMPEVYSHPANKFQFCMNAVETNRKNTHATSATLLLLRLL